MDFFAAFSMSLRLRHGRLVKHEFDGEIM